MEQSTIAAIGIVVTLVLAGILLLVLFLLSRRGNTSTSAQGPYKQVLAVPTNAIEFGNWRWTNDANTFNFINRSTGTVYTLSGPERKTTWEVRPSEQTGQQDHPDYLHMFTWSFGCNPTTFIIESKLTGDQFAMDVNQKASNIKKGTPMSYNVGYPTDIQFAGKFWTISSDVNTLNFTHVASGNTWKVSASNSTLNPSWS